MNRSLVTYTLLLINSLASQNIYLLHLYVDLQAWKLIDGKLINRYLKQEWLYGKNSWLFEQGSIGFYMKILERSSNKLQVDALFLSMS